MKNTLLALLGSIILTAPLAATAQQFGDFTYSTFGGIVTIIGYTGHGGAVTIPYSIGGLPVTEIGNNAFAYARLTSVSMPGPIDSIGDFAFEGCTSLTSVFIPARVGYIGFQAFSDCSSLIAITVSPANQWYSSADGVLFDKYRRLIQCPGGKAGSYSIPSGVNSILDYAFADCVRLTSVTIPGSVTYLWSGAFAYCSRLQGVFFKDSAPASDSSAFDGATNATVYYLPGTTGWGATFAGRPAVLWNPLMQTSGVGPAGFGFNITGTADIPIVVEAATSLANGAWSPLRSLNLTNGSLYFSDPNWTNYPARFYRIRSP